MHKSSYWTRFEAIEEQDLAIAEDQDSESDDGDIDMKDLEGRAVQNIAYNHQQAYNDEEMFNQEIEDIDSDDDQLLIMQDQMHQKQTTNNKVPGLQLGGLGLSLGQTQGTQQIPQQ